MFSLRDPDMDDFEVVYGILSDERIACEPSSSIWQVRRDGDKGQKELERWCLRSAGTNDQFM